MTDEAAAGIGDQGSGTPEPESLALAMIARAPGYHPETMDTGHGATSRRLATGLASIPGRITTAAAAARPSARKAERDRAELAARRLDALQALATDLAGALTTAQITEVLMARGVAALRADGAAVFLVEAGDDALTAIGWLGQAEGRARALARLSLDLPLPATDVARSGEPVFIEDPSDFLSRYRSTFARLGIPPHPRAVAAVPLEVDGRRFGVLGFNWNQWHSLEPDRRAFIAALARLGASAMERGRLFDAERAALHRAEAAQREVEQYAERERRHAAELEAAIGALGEGILVSNPDGTVRLSNAAAIRLLGGPSGTIDDVLDRLRDADGVRPTTLDRGPVEYRLVGRRAAWIEIAAYPVAGEAGLVSPSTVVVCRDVTAFRQGEDLREAFLGLLSHELRTPVTTIYGGAAVLVKPGKALDPAMANEILADIAAESDRLYRLVEDLLVLARFDEGFELGDEPVLLQHLVPAVVDQERGRWPAVRFEVAVAPDLPTAAGDETGITQVLRNLLSNAAKYSGGDAVVTAIVELDEDGVAVRVRDQGPGIDPGETEAIFDPFFRSPRTAKMAGGAGIGLYVSRRLVGAMNGRMWATARPDRGSEFSFVLPRYRADEDA